MGTDSDIFAMAEVVILGMIKAIDFLYDLIASFFDPKQPKDGPQQQSKAQADYNRLANNYIGNMTPAEKEKLLALTNKVASQSPKSGISGKQIMDYMQINQKENITKLQKELNIKDNRTFPDPEITKKEFTKQMGETLEKVKITPNVNPAAIKNDISEFVTVAPKKEIEEQTIYMHDIAIDGTLLKNTQQRYYTNSKTKIPAEILVTGNTKILENYIQAAKDKNWLGKDSQDMKHLEKRLDVMKTIEQFSKYNHCNENTKGVQPNDPKAHVYVKTYDGDTQKGTIIQGAQLKRGQDTSNGCWSCSMEVLLGAQGIALDQSYIRAYRPDYVNLGDGPKDPKAIDTINSNTMFSVMECAELVGKVAPNTMVSTLSTNTNDMKVSLQKVDKLIGRNVPVAFTDGSHWRTIVGGDKDNYYVIDSNSKNPTVPKVFPKSKFTEKGSYDFTWMEKMKVNENGEIENVNPEIFKVDKKSGLIEQKRDLNIDKNETACEPAMHKDGHFFESIIKDPDLGENLKVSTYLPKAYTKPGISYEEQQKLIEERLTELKKPSPKEKQVDMKDYKFTSMESFNKANMEKELKKSVVTKLKQHIAGYYLYQDQPDSWKDIDEQRLKQYEDYAKEMNKNPYEPVKLTKEEFKKFYTKDEPKPMSPEDFAKQFPQYVNKEPKPVNNDLLNKELQVPKELQVQNEQQVKNEKQVKNEIKNEEVKKDEKKEIEMALV